MTVDPREHFLVSSTIGPQMGAHSMGTSSGARRISAVAKARVERRTTALMVAIVGKLKTSDTQSGGIERVCGKRVRNQNVESG